MGPKARQNLPACLPAKYVRGLRKEVSRRQPSPRQLMFKGRLPQTMQVLFRCLGPRSARSGC